MGNGLATYYKTETRSKEFHAFDGLSWHDNAARFHDTLFPRFTTVDPLAEKYPDVSPYVFCNNNATRFIDINGMDAAVLTPPGIHVAILIQGKDAKWYYYSINGTTMFKSFSGAFGRPFNDIAVGPFDSPQDFLDSDYNTKLGKNNQTDPNSSSFGYESAYRIETTPEQDQIMAESMAISDKIPYDPVVSNCATAVKNAINKATGANIKSFDWPSKVVNKIKEHFPNGIEYTRGRAPEKNKKSITKAKKMSDPKTKRDDEERTEQGTEDDWR